MRTRTAWIVLAVCVGLTLSAPSLNAQDRGAHDTHRVSLGLAAGVVEPDGGGEIYYLGALRFRLFGDGDADRRGDDEWRYERRGDIQAYIEPEIGYWERDEDRLSESDLNVGINAIGVVPGRTVDYFFGVGLGLHFLDTQIDVADPAVPDVDESDEHFGGNFQVGLDIHLSERVSLFGAGRFDVIEGVDETLQGKVYMGLRFGFGD